MLNDLGKGKDYTNVSNTHEADSFQGSPRETQKKALVNNPSSSPNQYSMSGITLILKIVHCNRERNRSGLTNVTTVTPGLFGRG